MISFDRVSKRYEDGHDALREVSLDIDQDELVFLTGHSGAGKSTLLRLIMLMDRPTRGRVVVDGDPRRAPEEHEPGASDDENDDGEAQEEPEGPVWDPQNRSVALSPQVRARTPNTVEADMRSLRGCQPP